MWVHYLVVCYVRHPMLYSVVRPTIDSGSLRYFISQIDVIDINPSHSLPYSLPHSLPHSASASQAVSVPNTPNPNSTPNRSAPPHIFSRNFFLCHVSSQTSKPKSFVLTHVLFYCFQHLTSQFSFILTLCFTLIGFKLFCDCHLGPFIVNCHFCFLPQGA